jgi:hypothetical protein
VCEDGRETVSRCNGAGECAAGRPVSCGIYACGADRCLTSCAESSECAPGQRCENEICIPSNARCSEDLGESRPVNADAIACAPYRCDPATGACRATCNVSSECASGHACNPGTKSCERVSTPDSDEDGGCGCRTSPSASSNAWSGSALLVFLLALIRRVPRGGRGVSDYPLRCAHRTPPLDGSPRRRTRARARARAGD